MQSLLYRYRNKAKCSKEILNLSSYSQLERSTAEIHSIRSTARGLWRHIDGSKWEPLL